MKGILRAENLIKLPLGTLSFRYLNNINNENKKKVRVSQQFSYQFITMTEDKKD